VTVQRILITGEPVLHTPALAVTDFGPDLDDLVADMIATMREAPGVGLAAPQIGVPLRIFVWEWTDEDDVRHEGVVVNPQLERGPTAPPAEDPEDDEEGCLSVPDLRFPLQRAEHVVLRGFTPQQEPLEIAASGWLARIFQHEADHLDGTLYVDRLRFRHKRSAKKAIRAQGWGKRGNSWLPGADDFEGSAHESEEP
jgi:peptide deformylase